MLPSVFVSLSSISGITGGGSGTLPSLLPVVGGSAPLLFGPLFEHVTGISIGFQLDWFLYALQVDVIPVKLLTHKQTLSHKCLGLSSYLSVSINRSC